MGASRNPQFHMLQVFMPLLLQKPSLKSKNREHVKYLNKRMEETGKARTDLDLKV